jgi:outer membrane autotransporter protein
MTALGTRARLLAGAALGFGLTMLAAQPAQADSVCSFGFPTTTCTDPNGNGQIDVSTDAVASITIVDPAAVFSANGGFTTVTTTGYIESTTAGKGVIKVVDTTTGLTYTGTGSTLVGQAGATGATILDITAPEVTLNSGNLTALGDGSTALSVTTNGGAGSGGINATTDGNINSAGGPAVVLSSTNAAGDQNVGLTLNAGNTITSGNGDAVNISTAGLGGVNANLAGPVSATGGAGIIGHQLNSAGAGNVSVTTGAGAITGVGGILAMNDGTGGVSITAGAGLVDGTTLAGIYAASNNASSTGNVSVTVGSGGATGDNGVVATTMGTGAVSVTTGTGLVTGTSGASPAIGATINNAASTSNLTVNIGTGGVAGNLAGVSAITQGSGAVSVTSAGAINAATGVGINTMATTGGTTINLAGGSVNGATGGIQASSGGGAIAVTLSGGADVSTTSGIGINLASNGGAQTVTIGGGSVVGGPTAINSVVGSSLTVANAGTLGVPGGVAVSTDGLAATSITNQTGGILNGRVNLSQFNDSVTNGGTWNAAGAQNFLTGTDAVNNQSGGVLNTAAGTTFDGLESLSNSGTITTTGTLDFIGVRTTLTNSGTFNLTASSAVTGLGAATLGGTTNAGAGSSLAGTGAFSNSGTLITTGAFTLSGFTSLSNSGTLNLAPGTFTVPGAVFTNSGTINSRGAATITGQTSFANSGTINLQNGAVGDVLTVNSAFSGSGSSKLLIDYSGSAADELVINGAASGTTTINVTPTAGMVINPTGILVVDTGTTTSNAFVLGTTNVGLLDLKLAQVGQDYFLSSAPNIAAVEPVVIGDMASNLWYQSADIYSNYAALRRTDLGVNRTSNLGFWGQGYWGQDKDHGQDVSPFGANFTVGRVENKRWGIQAGVDYLIGTGAVLGVTGGYERVKSDVRNSASDFKAHGWNAGAYAMFGGGAGFYGDFLVKYDDADLKFSNPLFVGVTGNPKLKSWGAQGQAGYRFVSGAMNFDLGAGLAYVRSKIDDFAVGAIAFDFERIKSTRGDLSARAEFGNGAFVPFVEAKLFHEFNRNRNLTLASGGASDTIDGEGRGTWGRIEAGIGAHNGSGPILAAWGELGDVKGFGVKAGWRFGGSPVEVPPPPPPPPPSPPPPPATQTCPDGSVIAATMTCPVPPPPPAPPPPAQRGERG